MTAPAPRRSRRSPWRHDARRRARRRTAARLTMTSMMDIFTVLLLFLLKNFVVEPQLFTPHPDVELPFSTTQGQAEEAPVVVIGERGVLVADTWVATDAALRATDDPTIPPLLAELRGMRHRSETLRQRRGHAPGAPHRLTVQGDRDIPFAALERVLYTAHLAGYGQVSLATRKN